jgi:hypothetical protein
VDVFLVPLGSDRHELYCEPSDGDEVVTDADAPAPGYFARLRRSFSETLRAAELARIRRARGEHDPIDTWWERLRARVLAKVADAVAEQRLLWHIRHCDAVRLFDPPDMTADRAMAIMRESMVRDRDRHFRWLAIDSVLMVASGALVIVPGPNVLGYYLVFRVVGHFLSWRGARHALDGVTWTTAPCDQLVELRDALALPQAERDARVDDVAERLHLPRLPLFISRLAWVDAKASTSRRRPAA